MIHNTKALFATSGEINNPALAFSDMLHCDNVSDIWTVNSKKCDDNDETAAGGCILIAWTDPSHFWKCCHTLALCAEGQRLLL